MEYYLLGDIMEYKSTLPYPALKVESKNIEYAKMLLHPYASMISKDTSTHLYLYQSFIVDEEISETLKHIAIVEMHHLDMLARTINLLGLDPKYEVDDHPWTAQYVKYNKNISQMMLTNIKNETLAIKNYRSLIKAIDDRYIKQLLRRIIIDEEIHLKIFNDIYNKVKDT